MNKHFKRLISLSMICVMIFGSASINAKAAIKPEANQYITSDVKISDTVTDTYVTNKNTKQVDVVRVIRESDGTLYYYGWFDIRYKNEHLNRESDFITTKTNESVVITLKGEEPRVVANLDNEEAMNYGNSSIESKSMFPTPWVAGTPKYSNVIMDVGNVLTVATAIAGIANVGIGLVMTAATLIVTNNITLAYYVKTQYYRAYDALTQQYYYVTSFYTNANYTGHIDTKTSIIYEIYLG